MTRNVIGAALRALLIGLCAAVTHAALPPLQPEASLLWVRDGQLTRQAEELLAVLRRVEDFGLAREDFVPFVAALEEASGRAADPLDDKLLNDAARRLIGQLHSGRVDPRSAGYELRRTRKPLDAGAALQWLAAAEDVPQVLATFEPQSAQYAALKTVLTRYRRIPPELASLPAPRGVSVREGDVYPGAGNLRRLLAALVGEPIPSDDGSASQTDYDAELAADVTLFQQRHGLSPDGVLGRRTFDALTVPIARRVRQIELTLERWRWLPDITPPAVIVNVPQFMLYVLTDGSQPAIESQPLKIPVIVGQSARQTPVFDSDIEAVVFRPFWNVPDSILRDELLPLIAADPPGYLARHEMEIVRGGGDDAQVLPPDAASVALLRAGKARLRQRPGAANALGLIKFVLPNPYDVYLHSTPEPHLFSRDRRTFSHGCIRVSDASALAAYLLKDTPGGWNADAIEAATCGEKTFTVRLATPVPVFVLYGTVVMRADGAPLFFDDVYGYDRRLEALLAARFP